MPIAITAEDTKLSFAYAVNKVLDTCTINRDAEGKRTDGIMKTSGKVVTRFVANSVLAVAALVETVVKALFVAVTFIPSYLKSGPYDASKAALSLARRTTLEAFKGTLGFSTPKPKIELTKEVIQQDVVTVTSAPKKVVVDSPAIVEKPSSEIVDKPVITKPKQDLAFSNWKPWKPKQPTRTERFVKLVMAEPAPTTLVAMTTAILLNKVFDTNPYIQTAVNLTFCLPAIYGIGCGILGFSEGYADQAAYVANGISQAASFVKKPFITKTKPDLAIRNWKPERPTSTEQIDENLKRLGITIVAITAACYLNNAIDTNPYIRTAVNLSFCIPVIYGLGRGMIGLTECYAKQVAYVGNGIGQAGSFAYSKTIGRINK